MNIFLLRLSHRIKKKISVPHLSGYDSNVIRA